MTQNSANAPDQNSREDSGEINLPEFLISGLKQRYGPAARIPDEIDQCILADAHRYLDTLRPDPVRVPGPSSSDHRRIPRSAWPVTALGMTAAAIFMAVMLNQPGRPRMPGTQSTAELDTVTPGSASGDIDGNGRLDILDAFAMARSLLASDKPMAMAHDMNRDGRIDNTDVTLVAQRAVKL
jgi:Dockerin type I domain